MIDLHSDTIFRLWEDGDRYSLLSNPYMVDKEKLLKGGVKGQCLALFTPMFDVRIERDRDKSPWQIANELYDRFLLEIDRAGIPQMNEIEDLDRNELSAILTMEEGAPIEGDISRLMTLKEWGVKIFGLVWGFENELAFPSSKDSQIMSAGLKDRGFEALSECERLGILVDVSHLSDGGFWDIVKAAKRPFLATHSNSRAMTPSTRNLTDEMLKALADKGGVAGLNLCPDFLISSGSKGRVSTVSDMVRHTNHILNVAGEDVLAIGTDFDGISGELDIGSPDMLYLLRDALGKAGISERIIDKMFYGNAKRILS